MRVCVCVCVYPGYVQSPGWDGRTLIYLQNLVGKNVTVKVPPQNQVMFSFRDVQMRGTAANWRGCGRWGFRVAADITFLTARSIYACELISLPPVLRDFDKMSVFVPEVEDVFEDCTLNTEGKNVHVSCLIMFSSTMIGSGVMCRKIEIGEGTWRQLNNRETGGGREGEGRDGAIK